MVQELDAAAAAEELRQCARFGEDEEAEELVKTYPEVDVNQADAYGATALHMAAANGHEKMVQWLLTKGAVPTSSASGCSPLHWALMNKQVGCARAFLEGPAASAIDVLAHDGAGKTAVTYAYEVADTELLQLVLEHPSAARLNKDGSVAAKGEKSDLQKAEEAEKAGQEVEDNPGGEQTVTSTIALRGKEVQVREVGFVEACPRLAADESDLQTTGAFLWAASLILAQWIADELEAEMNGKCVVELGAGCGLPGLVASACTEASSVTITDLASPTLENTKHNVTVNQTDGKTLELAELDWCKKSTWPETLIGAVNVLVGSDLVYDIALVEPLVNVVNSLVAPGGSFHYVSADTGRQGCAEFVAALEAAGWAKTTKPAPEAYNTNPFLPESCDDAAFALRFPEFAQATFTMYTFTRKADTQ